MRIHLLLSAVALLVASHVGTAATFHVAPDGNDQNDGSVSTPWRTLAKANRSVSAGDTVLVAPGVYRDRIEPANSGTSQAPVVFRSQSRGQAVISPSNSAEAVLISNRSHVTVDGFSIEVSGVSGRSFNIDLRYSNGIEIENCRLRGARSISEILDMARSGTQEGGIRVLGGSDNTLRRNTIELYSFQAVKLTGLAKRVSVLDNEIRNTFGDSVRIDSGRSALQGHLIEGNTLSGSLASDGVQTNADFEAADTKTDTSNRGIIIRDNTIYGHGENGIDLKGASYVLVERNRIFSNVSDNDGATDGENDRQGTPGGIGKGSNTSSETVIVRHNLIYDNNAGTMATQGWKVYNNTFVGNNRDYTGPDSDFDPRGRRHFVGLRGEDAARRISVKNNIFVDHGHAEIRLHPDSQVDIDHNLYYNRTGKPQLALQGWDDTWEAFDLPRWQQALRRLPRMSGYDQNSQVADPAFTSPLDLMLRRPEGVDLSLSDNSPAIDAGAPLTRTSSEGSGRVIGVDDAGYFFDGMGVVTGDLLVVGSSTPVRVLNVDYARDLITVESPLSWQRGDGVSLPFSGRASDVGALEFGGENWFGVPAAPMLFSD